jgi:hypothetical protein
LKGGDGVGSRVRIAAASCLVVAGLLAGGASATMAFADPLRTSGDSGDNHTNNSSGNGAADKPKSDPDEKKTPPGVGRRPGGSGSEHSGDVGSGKEEKEEKDGADPGEHKPGGNKPDGTKPDGHKPDEQKPDEHVGEEEQGGEEPGNFGEVGQDPNNPTSPTKPPQPGDCAWWPWPWEPAEPGGPPAPGNGGGGTAPHAPSGRPGRLPPMQLPHGLMPPATEPVEPSVIDVAPGVGVAAAELPIAPITLPVIVAPVTGLGGGGGGSRGAGEPALPGTARGVTAEPPKGREPLPANVGSNAVVPASSYRIGYPEYLRSAGLSQVVALAAPGVAGMLVLTGAGGLVGYRQAKAGHAVRTSGTARFVN